LTGFAKIKKGENVLDLGCGTGVIPVLLSAKSNGSRFTGIEIQENLADLAQRNVSLNNLSERIKIINADINEIKNIIGAGSFDAVTANPPYIKNRAGIKNISDSKTIARHEIKIDLRGIISAAAWALRFGGRLYMIHRPERLVEIIKTLSEHKLEMKALRFVHSFADKKPSMALIEAAYGGKTRLGVMPPLIIYKEPGVYSDEVTEIYYGGHQ